MVSADTDRQPASFGWVLCTKSYLGASHPHVPLGALPSRAAIHLSKPSKPHDPGHQLRASPGMGLLPPSHVIARVTGSLHVASGLEASHALQGPSAHLSYAELAGWLCRSISSVHYMKLVWDVGVALAPCSAGPGSWAEQGQTHGRQAAARCQPPAAPIR